MTPARSGSSSCEETQACSPDGDSFRNQRSGETVTGLSGGVTAAGNSAAGCVSLSNESKRSVRRPAATTAPPVPPQMWTASHDRERRSSNEDRAQDRRRRRPHVHQHGPPRRGGRAPPGASGAGASEPVTVDGRTLLLQGLPLAREHQVGLAGACPRGERRARSARRRGGIDQRPTAARSSHLHLTGHLPHLGHTRHSDR